MSSHAKIASHQTVRLSRGKHRGPADGVCAMELASMLAGERFSDHPRSVCPVIGAFLRAYNDHVDDTRRQDLYAFAAESVGTRGDRHTRRQRVDLCRCFAAHCAGIKPPPTLRVWCIGEAEWIGSRAALAAASPEQPQGHSMALALLDALIACGQPEPERSSAEGPRVSLRAPR